MLEAKFQIKRKCEVCAIKCLPDELAGVLLKSILCYECSFSSISRQGFTNNSIAISTHRPLSEACQHSFKNVQTSLKNITKN